MSSARKFLLAIALAAAWTVGVASSASAASCPNAALQATALTTAEIESSIGCLINDVRTDRGLRPLQPNGALRAAALSHSSEMVSQGYFDHTSPAGLTFIDRIAATGYMRGTRSWVVGENLIWGTESESTPQAMVTDWLNSPPHRENLLRARFREIGIAALMGTPEGASDPTGVTVSSEYGYRLKGNGKRTRKARARRR